MSQATPSSAQFNLIDLGARVRSARGARGLTLELLAARAGVSRGMIAAVETGSKAPSVLILHKIATGLGVSMSRLLGEEQDERVIRLPRAEQVVVRDPTGWERRNLAPVLPGVEFEFMRTTIPPGVNAGGFPPHARGSREYVAVESGILELSIDDRMHTLDRGDSIAYAGDCRHGFANPGAEPCVYYLALEGGVASSNRSHHAVRRDRQGETP